MIKLKDLLEVSTTGKTKNSEELGGYKGFVKEEDFDKSVFEYAKELAKSVSPRSVRIMKEQIYNAQRETIEENLESSMKAMVESFDTEDFKEGVAHFIEKREANFTGK